MKFEKSLRTISLQNTSDDCYWFSNTTINISANATFQQSMVTVASTDCCNEFHQANFRFGCEEVQIDIEFWLANANQKLIIDTERWMN